VSASAGARGQLRDGPLRVAWLGVTPTTHGGVPYAATQSLLALAEQGVRIDCFVTAGSEELPSVLRERPEITFVQRKSWWQWDRWYSRTALSAMYSGLLARSMTQYQLAATIARRHARSPYDVVYQFGPVELQGLGMLRRFLPPIMLHPGTHAAGELRWYRREASLARRAGEPLTKRTVVRALLTVRTLVQRRDMRRARLTVAVSAIFARDLADDYRVRPEALFVVYYPIDLRRFTSGTPSRAADAPIRLIFVAAMTVRKGVEMVVELSHRLDDEAGRVQIDMVGAARQWSDYRPLLRDINPRVAHWWQEMEPDELAELRRRTDVALQPSHYEPGAIAFIEALASGTPIVASDAVGPAEAVDRSCCRVFPAGDLDAFEAAVRDLIADLRRPDGERIRRTARAEAERLFGRGPVGEGLVAALERAAGRPREPGA
jgi:glycosyltransferase involved in cell wall biosynthesis